MKILVAFIVMVLAAVFGCVVVVGWVYEGPRRFFRRLRLRRAMR